VIVHFKVAAVHAGVPLLMASSRVAIGHDAEIEWTDYGKSNSMK
jgi:hypothetical protein